MKRISSALTVIALAAMGACSRQADKRADTALNTDLSLAAQQRGYQPLDSLSAAERANALTTPAPAATAPARTRTSSGEVARSTTTRRTSSTRSNGTRSTGTRTGSSSGTVASAPAEPREVTVKHPQRDAAIGAAAGAIIGATTSRNKVKGGVIGAAVGGILGGVIGNNVDKQKKRVP
jgi:hypothetical protein